MKQISDLKEIQHISSEARKKNLTIGFVPTMGALHEGHLQLIRAAVTANDIVICSIFVNPTQFNNQDDYNKYPRLLDADAALLAASGCHYLFVPEATAMYPQQPITQFSFSLLENVMEGAHRPGHFNGVATVVSKFFHLVQPHKAYFGQKDLQQFAIVRQFVTDLNFNLELICYPIVREADGLAMSSRNRRLTAEQRQLAPQLYKALQLAEQMTNPTNQPETVKQAALDYLKKYPEIRTEYIEVADARTLQPIKSFIPGQQVAICLAAFLGEIRLIDNIVLKIREN